MGSGASTLEGIDKTKLEALQAELKKPADLSDLAEGSAKDEVKKIRELFNASGLDKVGSDEVKKEAGKPADCSDIADDGKAELTRLRSLLSELNAKEGSPENPTAENPAAENAINNKNMSRLPFCWRYEHPSTKSPVYTFIRNTSTAAPVYE